MVHVTMAFRFMVRPLMFEFGIMNVIMKIPRKRTNGVNDGNKDWSGSV